MAMQLPDHDDAAEVSEINVTPLVDVMLVLLVVFIVTAPLLTQAVKVNLPKTERTAPADSRHIAVLAVDAQGQAVLDDRAVAPEALEAELRALLQRDPEISVQLQADRGAVFDHVANVMACAQRSGISRLSFVTLQR